MKIKDLIKELQQIPEQDGNIVMSSDRNLNLNYESMIIGCDGPNYILMGDIRRKMSKSFYQIK